jgi:hypothetical protein
MNTWKINCNSNQIIDFVNSKNIDIIINKRFLINKQFDNFIESYVFKIADFHLNQRRIKSNSVSESIMDLHIEFMFYNSTYFSCKKRLYNDLYALDDNNTFSPLVTTITYFNDNTSPTLITNINHKEYKYKDFYDKLGLFFSFPKKQKHISFENADNYYGKFNSNGVELNDSVELIIKIWETKPDIPYFKFTMENFNSKHTEIEIFEAPNKVFEININDDKYNDLLNFNFFDEIIYSLNSDFVNNLKNIIDNNNFDDFIIINTPLNVYNGTPERCLARDSRATLPINELKGNPQNVDCPISNLDRCKEIENSLSVENDNSNKFLESNEILVEIYPKFNQRYQLHRYYNMDICDWIIQEINDSAIQWKIDSKYYYIIAENVPSVFNFILISIKNIIEKLENLYTINNLNYKITDILFIKYDNTVKLSKYEHSNYYDDDGSSFTFKLLLSNVNNYSGGNIIFEDLIENIMNTGDVIIYNGRVKYFEKPILSGEKIYLVCKLNIYNATVNDQWWHNDVRKQDKFIAPHK